MAAETLETWFFNGQEYVTPKVAARYLGIHHKTFLNYILDSKIGAVQKDRFL